MHIKAGWSCTRSHCHSIPLPPFSPPLLSRAVLCFFLSNAHTAAAVSPSPKTKFHRAFLSRHYSLVVFALAVAGFLLLLLFCRWPLLSVSRPSVFHIVFAFFHTKSTSSPFANAIARNKVLRALNVFWCCLLCSPSSTRAGAADLHYIPSSGVTLTFCVCASLSIISRVASFLCRNDLHLGYFR